MPVLKMKLSAWDRIFATSLKYPFLPKPSESHFKTTEDKRLYTYVCVYICDSIIVIMLITCIVINIILSKSY